MKIDNLPPWAKQMVLHHIEYSLPVSNVGLNIHWRDPDYEIAKQHDVSFEVRHKFNDEAKPTQIMIDFRDEVKAEDVMDRMPYLSFFDSFISGISDLQPDLIGLKMHGQDPDFFEHYTLHTVNAVNPNKSPFMHLIDEFKHYLTKKEIY